jgi:hypothetical protein
LTHSLQAPGFQPFEVKTRFQSLLSNGSSCTATPRRDGSAQLWFNDKHVDILSRWLYPIAAIIATIYLRALVADQGLPRD